ncbi:MAG: UvrD-helicase domain-containing protein [Gammaproteobacteria bacterium]|nr:UvrD-helicase domain-containing protein [Gammaproteobacteria bacterium]
MLNDAAARRQALDPAGSFIVQAPAGSGKTELLTQRFLKLLSVVEQPEEIVAVTFTRKAAAEMRERILDTLAAGRGPAPQEEHRRQAWDLARAALARDDERGWNILANPNRLRVETLDALNGALTRQLPLLTGFGQQPGIEEQADELYAEAAERCLAELGEQDEWTDAMAGVLMHLDNRYDRLRELLVKLLGSRDVWLSLLAGSTLNRNGLEHALATEIEAELARADSSIPASTFDRLISICARLAPHLDALGIETDWLWMLARMEHRPAAGVEHLGEWQALARLLLTGGGRLRKTVDKRLGFPTDDKPLKADMLELLQGLSEDAALEDRLRRVRDLPPPRYSDAQWAALQNLSAVLPMAVAQLQLVFAERGKVDFSEMALRARQALGEPDNPTRLALYLEHRIRHLLVDEFQDTSEAQVDLLLRLTAGWTEDDGHSLFLVGDPMQSIYRFRQAEVGLFLKVRESGLGQLKPQALQLSSNFRSQAGIVDWVNRAFAEIFPAEEDMASGAIRYAESQPVHPSLPGEAVSWHPLHVNDPRAEAAQVVTAVQDFEADAAAETLAILVRSRTHLVDILPALRDAGIAYRAVELETLGHLPVVQDVLSLATALQNPAHRTAWLSLLRSPVCGLELADLHVVAGIGSNIPDALHDLEALQQAGVSEPGCQRLGRLQASLQAAASQRGRQGLTARTRGCWLALGFPETLASAVDVDNAELAFDLLRSLEEAGDIEDINDVGEALERLFAAPDNSAGQAVQVMTLHKAKGLQFDWVLMPGLGRPTRGQDSPLLRWLDRPRPRRGSELLLAPIRAAGGERDPHYDFIGELMKQQDAYELVRLLYVGTTRARHRLHLFGHAAAKRNRQGGVDAGEPASRSALAALWPMAEPAFAASFDAAAVPDDDVTEGPGSTARLRRVPAGWQSKDWPEPVLPPPAREPDVADDIVFDWAGDTARHVGTAVHRCIELWMTAGDSTLLEDPTPLLQDLGIPAVDMPAAKDRVLQAMEAVRSSQHAGLLFDRAASDARNEWQLGGLVEGELVNVTIDRSFVAADGRRWIVDYKTSEHEGGDLDDFLARERERYRSQLERYAALVGQLEDRDIMLALYFPLHDELLCWPAGEGEAGKR